MKFNVGDQVYLVLDKTKQKYVIVGKRQSMLTVIYDITVPKSYKYDEAWEEDLILVEDPNNIIKTIL